MSWALGMGLAGDGVEPVGRGCRQAEPWGRDLQREEGPCGGRAGRRGWGLVMDRAVGVRVVAWSGAAGSWARCTMVILSGLRHVAQAVPSREASPIELPSAP